MRLLYPTGPPRTPSRPDCLGWCSADFSLAVTKLSGVEWRTSPGLACRYSAHVRPHCKRARSVPFAQLYQASYNGDVAEVTRLVVAARADVNWEDEVVPVSCCVLAHPVVQAGWSPLIAAAGGGHTGAIAELVRLGADVNRHKQ
jgi:hypothetical protein